MSALMSDVLEGRTTPGVCNAAVNAGGKLLKVVDMAHRYGVAGPDSERHLLLTGGPDDAIVEAPPRKARIAELERELKTLKAS